MTPSLLTEAADTPTRHTAEYAGIGSPGDMNSPLHASMARGPCKLFVGGISAQTTTEALRTHFSKYGRLIDAVVMSKNGRPRGFGFVTFDMTVPALKALAEPQWLDGRLVDVKRAVPGERTQERTSNKIFVGGLPQDVSTEDLKAYFATYGPVADAVVMVDRRTNRSRGFGFVRFANGAHGNAAAEAVLMDFASHHLAGKWVEVKRATPAAVLQALSPCDSGVDGILSCTSLAAMDQSMGFYLMDMSGSDCMCAMTPETPSDVGLGTPARGHARGRRGRRRKQRTSNASDWTFGDDFSGAEDGADDRSPCSVVLPGSGSGSPLSTCMGSPPGLDGIMGGAVAIVPTGSAGAAAASAHANAIWGSPQGSQGLPKQLLPLTVEPLNFCSLGSDPVVLTPGRRCDESGRSSYGSADADTSFDSAENDPRRANCASSKVSGVDASPMKVACRDGYWSSSPWLEDKPEGGCTRQDFLSLEVRPWLSAW